MTSGLVTSTLDQLLAPRKQRLTSQQNCTSMSNIAYSACRGLSDLQQQTITINAEDLAGGEYSLTNLTACTVHLEGPMSALQIRNLAACLICTGPVSGPTFVYGEVFQAPCM